MKKYCAKNTILLPNSNYVVVDTSSPTQTTMTCLCRIYCPDIFCALVFQYLPIPQYFLPSKKNSPSCFPLTVPFCSFLHYYTEGMLIWACVAATDTVKCPKILYLESNGVITIIIPKWCQRESATDGISPLHVSVPIFVPDTMIELP